jgi:hypothetical protein
MPTRPLGDLARALALPGEVGVLALLASLRFVAEPDLLRAGALPETLDRLALSDLTVRLPLQRTLTGAPVSVFALRRAGAVVLAQALALDPKEVPSDTLSSCRRTTLWLDHSLARSRFALLLAGALGGRLGAWSQRESELQITATARGGGALRAERPVIPDALARVRAGGREEALVIEIDRGTERPSYMAAKYAAYRGWWKSGEHARALGTPAVRILTVAPDRRRARRLLAACREGTAERTSGLFWFAAEDELERDGPLAPVWSTMSGDDLALWAEAPR